MPACSMSGYVGHCPEALARLRGRLFRGLGRAEARVPDVLSLTIPTSHNVYNESEAAHRRPRAESPRNYAPQQRLNFFPDPHGHAPLRDTSAEFAAAFAFEVAAGAM